MERSELMAAAVAGFVDQIAKNYGKYMGNIKTTIETMGKYGKMGRDGKMEEIMLVKQ